MINREVPVMIVPRKVFDRKCSKRVYPETDFILLKVIIFELGFIEIQRKFEPHIFTHELSSLQNQLRLLRNYPLLIKPLTKEMGIETILFALENF